MKRKKENLSKQKTQKSSLPTFLSFLVPHFQHILLLDIWTASAKLPNLLLCAEITLLSSNLKTEHTFWLHPTPQIFPTYQLLATTNKFEIEPTSYLKPLQVFWQNLVEKINPSSSSNLFLLHGLDYGSSIQKKGTTRTHPGTFSHIQETIANLKLFVDLLNQLVPDSTTSFSCFLLTYPSSVGIALPESLHEKKSTVSPLSTIARRHCELY